MLSVTYKPYMLNVVMVNVIMVNLIMLHVVMLNVVMMSVPGGCNLCKNIRLGVDFEDSDEHTSLPSCGTDYSSKRIYNTD